MILMITFLLIQRLFNLSAAFKDKINYTDLHDSKALVTSCILAPVKGAFFINSDHRVDLQICDLSIFLKNFSEGG